MRGIYNKILELGVNQSQAGFITASSGNHGMGLAYVCQELGLRNDVVAPVYTHKKKSMRSNDLAQR